MAGDTLLIRADAGTQMGTGHVMRCLALTQAWQEAGGRVWFAQATSSAAIEARLCAEGIEVAHVNAAAGSEPDAAQTIRLAHAMKAAWVVVDGYQFDAAYQRAITDAGLHLLFVDDYGHASRYHADLILNQNISAEATLYATREPHTRLLLGTHYALLRREFWSWRDWRRVVPPVASKVLVTLGGSDPANVTLKAITAVQLVGAQDIQVVVAIGSSNIHFEQLQAASEGATPAIQLVRDQEDMPQLMAWADVAISAGGSTCWELAFMQLPDLIIVLAENQHPIGAGLAAAGTARNLGWHEGVSAHRIATALEMLLASKDSRTAMAECGRHLVDGCGAHRVVDCMRAEPCLRAREAGQDDIGSLFAWANDPLTRQMSFRSHPISWEDHQQWCEAVISNPDIVLMIVEFQELGEWVPVGQVRVDLDGTVSITIAPDYRGRHLAAGALRAAIAYHNARFSKDLWAYIKPDNVRSQSAFVLAGFEFLRRTEIAGQPCLEYARRR